MVQVYLLCRLDPAGDFAECSRALILGFRVYRVQGWDFGGVIWGLTRPEAIGFAAWGSLLMIKSTVP